MKKFNWNAPITWKGYMKFGVIASIIGVLISGIYWVVLFRDELDDWWDAHKPEIFNR